MVAQLEYEEKKRGLPTIRKIEIPGAENLKQIRITRTATGNAKVEAEKAAAQTAQNFVGLFKSGRSLVKGSEMEKLLFA